MEQKSLLNGKTILLGIAGGIAAYKSCDLTRLLKKSGTDVHVVMTRAACEFVTPLTFQTLSGNEVHYEMFRTVEKFEIGHISLAERADAIVIAPATADIIAKLAHGICDELLTATIMSATAPIIICPSMNARMWAKPILQHNLKMLKEFGHKIVEPEEGDLACGTEGKGRLPSPETIVREIENLIGS